MVPKLVGVRGRIPNQIFLFWFNSGESLRREEKNTDNWGDKKVAVELNLEGS